MKDLIEVLNRLWSLVKEAPRWVQALAAIVLFIGVAEVSQCGFLGSPMFWATAPVLPWPQVLEPERKLSATYMVMRSSDLSPVHLGFGAPGPVGSHVDV